MISRKRHQQPRRHRRNGWLITVVAASMLAGCAVAQVIPPPDCATGGSSIIGAQSVMTATQIPCITSLPDGWSVDEVHINQDRTVLDFDSDRAGEGAASMRFESSCDTSAAVSVPSDEPVAERFDEIQQVEPSFKANRYYVFEGGCVSWVFRFDRGVSATESVAIGEILVLVSREEVNDGLRLSFIDEDL